jgi:hypothetical protein
VSYKQTDFVVWLMDRTLYAVSTDTWYLYDIVRTEAS